MQNQSLYDNLCIYIYYEHDFSSLYELSKYMQKLVKIEYPAELKYVDGNAIENW